VADVAVARGGGGIAAPPAAARRRGRLSTSEAFAGWVFIAPALIGLLIFTVLPILMAFVVSLTDWNGISAPTSAGFVGAGNYSDLLFESGVARQDFALAIRNNFYYVLGVVPAQTALAFLLAVIVNQKFLRGKGFFRTGYYLPSITSSIAVSMIFIFLFQRNGAVNAILGALTPIDGLNWLDNADGVFHNLLGLFGVDTAPAFLADSGFMGLSLWQWLSGPSVTMLSLMILATWTTIGTLMLIFLAGLQNIPGEVEEASKVDGATARQHFFFVTLPMMRPTLFFVLTISLIGTWQVFDQVFAISAGGPQKTTLTPAYLVYREGFRNFGGGRAAAVAFLLFLIIIAFNLIQRRLVRSDED
jgi:multiple sugar transport system permease protein